MTEKNGQVHCLTYNNNLDNAFVATKLGVQDMLIVSLSINFDKYPPGSFLSGVYITLHSQERTAHLSSGLLASPGEIFLVRLKKSVNEYLNSTTSVESFDAKISTLGDQLFESKWGPKNDTIVLAFTYQDLDVMIVRELPPYNTLSFLSETGGVLGLLLGTSLVNLIIFLIQWCWGLGSNELNWASVQNKREVMTDQPNNDLFSNNIGKNKLTLDTHKPEEERLGHLKDNFCLV